MGIRFSRAFAAACGVLTLAAASGTARADASGLDWVGVVYLWGANVGVDARDRSANFSFGDIIDKLDMGSWAGSKPRVTTSAASWTSSTCRSPMAAPPGP